jgi:hypothetical protein
MTRKVFGGNDMSRGMSGEGRREDKEMIDVMR